MTSVVKTPSLNFSNLIKRGRKKCFYAPNLTPVPILKTPSYGTAASILPSSEASHPSIYFVYPTSPARRESKQPAYNHFKHAYLLQGFFLNCHFSAWTEPTLSIYSLLVWLSKDWKKGTILQTSKRAHESFTVWKPSLPLWRDKREVRTYYWAFILTTIM